jgi:hypothetical protein
MTDEQILQARLEQLEAWVSEVISRPSMSREMRWRGLEMLEEARAINPEVRKSVERICPKRLIEHGLELEQTIER